MRPRFHHRCIAVLLALGITSTSITAAAAPAKVFEDPEAQEHFERAQTHFGAEEYQAAIPELKAAYAIEPNPMLLYAWAQAERLAGNCSRAIELYRGYLETGPEPEQRRLTEANLLDCEAEIPDESESESEPEDPPSPPWRADPLGGIFVGLGAAGIVSGSALMIVARRRAQTAPMASIEGDYLDQRAQAERLNIAGIIALSAGGALALGGVTRYLVVARKGRSNQAAFKARVTPSWTGVMLGLERTF